MKIGVKQYAQSLLELVAEKSAAEAKPIINRFITFLHQRQDLNKAAAIILELERLYAEQSGVITAEVLSARPLSALAKQKITVYLETRAGVAKVDLQESIDETLIGGFVLRYNGLVIDGSIKNNLLKFKKQLSN